MINFVKRTGRDASVQPEEQDAGDDILYVRKTISLTSFREAATKHKKSPSLLVRLKLKSAETYQGILSMP